MDSERSLEDWLSAYMVYTAESESPDEFHLWCGLSNIAAVLRRRVFFNMGYFTLYPNLYVVLVSPPGRCKKSTAMRMARGIMAPIPNIKMSSDSSTRERLIQDLSISHKDGYSAMTAHSSEFATMLTSSGMDMVVFLTDIYDCPIVWSHTTKTQGTSEIKAPFLNLLAGTTPDWIAKAMPLDTIGVGLTSRVIFVYSDTPRIRDPIPELSPQQIALSKILTNDLGHIATISGEYKFTPQAKEFYSDWYKGRIAAPNPTGDPRLGGYFERKPMHVIKVAMLIAASRHDNLELDVREVDSALKLLGDLEPRMQKTFSGVGKNPLNTDIEEVLSKLLSRPEGIEYSELLDQMRFSVSRKELDDVIETLIIAKHITRRGTRIFLLT